MNLHGIVSGAISAVNPLIFATLFVSTGYTTGGDGTQISTYSESSQTINSVITIQTGQPLTDGYNQAINVLVTSFNVLIQVQQLSAHELSQRDMLNLQSNVRRVYLNGDWNGIVRPDSKGGDKMTFNGQNWLIVAVPEQFPDWTQVIVCRQY